ncbi:hypothetical protein [Geomonas anaerohicana]|uniref:Uncharacterized protein n=1 Tax=Geomonas anaerohicana TaxID=2798583 RepID=A0ABS0YKI8_9BACT|nr:hypothetical protein [Geomonas anaerohicana]MBJ6752861.1 hypothetical protein [Geomonas anaerohicana]
MFHKTGKAPDQPDPMILLQLYVRAHDDDVVINPKAITIKNGKGVTFRPVRALGPVAPHSIPLNLVDVTYDKEDALRPGSYIRVKSGKTSCFLLQYDMASSPDWNISMQVDAIKIGSHPNPPEQFTFKRGSAVYLIWGGREELCADMD